MIKRMIEGVQRSIRQMGFVVDGTGTASITSGSTQGTLVDNGTGDYTLTFSDVYERAPIVVVTPVTADVNCNIDAVSASAVSITCFDSTDGTTAKDADFHMIVMGYDAVEEL